MKNTLFYLTIITICLASCKKDSPNNNTATVPNGAVILLNEGGFGAGNASVTLYDTVTKTVTQDLFAKINNRPLGDVAQSILIYNDKGYIVVNNSAKIEVVDMATFKSLGTITIPGSSPRYILPVGGSKAYVSDLYAGKLNIIDLNAYSLTGSITLPGETEQMALINNKAYVLNIVNTDSTLVQVIDPNTDTKTATIPLTLKGGVSMVKDNASKLWVLCSPYDTTHTKASGLVKISTTSASVELTLPYALTQSGFSALTASPNGNTLCFIDYTGLYKMNSTDVNLPTTPFIAAGTHSFYGVGIDNTNQKIYVTDAGNYNSNGKVYAYNLTTGAVVDSFAAGIIPGHFGFK